MNTLLVNIDVPDLNKACDFYTKAFDLKVGRKFDGAIELLGFPSPLYLLEKGGDSVAVPHTNTKRDYSRHWTPVHLDIEVKDMDEALKKAQEAGAIIEGSVLVRSWGKLLGCSDPFGNGFCLIQFLGRGYDEITR